MAKVILTGSLASPDKSWSAGDEYECSDAEAARLIERGHAKAGDAAPAKGATKRRTATAPGPAENADG